MWHASHSLEVGMVSGSGKTCRPGSTIISTGEGGGVGVLEVRRSGRNPLGIGSYLRGAGGGLRSC